MHKEEHEVPEHSGRQEVDAVGMMLMLARHKRLIVGLPLVAALLATAVCLIIPNTYKANTKLLPPQQAQSGAAALLAQLGGVAGAAAAGATGIKNPNDLYVGMLRSRRIADKLIADFNLKAAYGTDSQEKARKILDENTLVLSGKDNLINIEVEDDDKERVVKLANAYADELLKLTKVIAVTEASQRRLFFERQLETSKNNLATAESTLDRALANGGVISVDSDSRAIVETVSKLRAQIAAKEIQLNSMRTFVTSENQDFKRINEELRSMRVQLGKLQNGSGETGVKAGGESGLDNIKFLRDVKYHQMLYELLSKQYEVARLDEAKDASIIQVLDPAAFPEKKFKPKTGTIVALTTIFAFLFAIGLAWAKDANARAQLDPRRAARMRELRLALFGKPR